MMLIYAAGGYLYLLMRVPRMAYSSEYNGFFLIKSEEYFVLIFSNLHKSYRSVTMHTLIKASKLMN